MERSDFQVENHGLKYGRADKNARVYLAAKEGEIVKIAVEKDAEVKKGDLLLEFDLKAIEAAGFSAVTPILVTNAAGYAGITAVESDYVTSGEAFIMFQ